MRQNRRRSHSALARAATAIAPVVEALEPRQLMTVFANGIDSENMGKGMWAWDLKRAMENTGYWPDGPGGSGGTPNYTGFFQFQKNQGMNYLITKAAQTVSTFVNTAGVVNYTSAVVNAAHAAGVKILPYFYIHGVDTTGEAAKFNEIMTNVGGDGVVFDIEGEYVNAQPSRDVAITNYFAGIGKSQSGNGSGSRDNLFMAYSSFPYASVHGEVPYALLGDYCDANMPQAYWSEWNTEPLTSRVRPSNEGQPMTPTMVVDDVNSQYSQIAFDNLTTVFYQKPQSIKPIAITGMTYDAANTTTAAEITEFVNAAKASTQVPFTGPSGVNTFVTGYRSINFFDENSTSAAERTALAAAQVGFAPGTPTSPSPANGTVFANGNNIVLNWGDVVNVYTGTQTGGATSYQVFLDNMSTPIATVLVTGHAVGVDYSRWASPGAIAPGNHTWKVVAKNDLGSASSAVWSFSVTAPPLPGVPSNPTPNNVYVTSKPVVLDWDDAANATSYDVYLGNNVNPNYTDLTVSNTPSINPTDGERLWRVVAKNAGGSTNGPQWSYIMDSAAPEAVYGNQQPTAGAAALDFTVSYSDATSGVLHSALDGNDVIVDLPGGGTATATLVGVDLAGNGTPRVATYRIAAPGGTWDVADSGTYTIRQAAGEVRDVAGNFRAGVTLGTFSVNLFAYQVGATLHVDFDGTAMPIALAPVVIGGNPGYSASRDGTTLNFSGVTAIAVAGTNADDHLRIGGALPVPLSFDNGAGSDSVTVTDGGTYTFATELNPALRNIDVTVDAGATALFATATFHADRLTVDGDAAILADGGRTLVVKELVIGAAGRLDLSDNDMVIDYEPATPSPIGAFDGTAYTGVHGLIQQAYNFGGWDMPGIYTSQANAGSAVGMTTLAVGEAADAFFLGGSDTAAFNGATVDATAIVIKYTYAGDVNFDGVVDGSDYGTLDNWIQFPGTSGFMNGDVNYDGIIDGADYGTLDNAIQLQGDPL